MVEWKKLGEVISVHTGQQLNRNDMTEIGTYPVMNGGRVASGYTDKNNEFANSITISQGGESAGFVNWIDKDFWAGAHCYVVENTAEQNIRYIFHFLKACEYKIMCSKQGAGIPGLSRKNLYSIIIPIPPMAEQERIVGILDTFTASIDNLKAQIEQRRKQYEHYRDQLLDLEGKEGVEMKTLGDVCYIKTGSKPSEIKEKGKYKYINAGTTESGYVDVSNCNGDVVTTPSRGQGGIGFVGYQCQEFWLGPLCYQIQSNDNEKLKSKFLYYYLSSHTDEILRYKSEGGTPAVNATDLKKILIPLPSLQEQERIVSILDKFEQSIANLEAQLEQRQKQYEYYREKLLTFE